jgi:competence protein ComEA
LYRSQHGPFGKIEDLRNVKGIGEKKFAAIREYLTTGK